MYNLLCGPGRQRLVDLPPRGAHLNITAGLPVVLHFHEESIDPWWVALAQRRVARWTDRAFAVSDAVGAWCGRKFGVPADKIETLPNGIPIEQFDVDREAARRRIKDEFNISPTAPIVTIIGRLSWEKGHRIMFDALSILRDEFDGLKAQIRRGNKTVDLKLSLAEGWRRRDDLSWRVTSWPLRRMATGGLVLAELTAEQRGDIDMPDKDAMALLVKHVGQYGLHAAAKKAGFRKGDVVVSYDGRTNLKRETDVIVYAVTARKPGDRVPVTVLRGKQRLTLMLPMQK